MWFFSQKKNITFRMLFNSPLILKISHGLTGIKIPLEGWEEKRRNLSG